MAYVDGNPKTKAELKRIVKAGGQPGIFSPGPFPLSPVGTYDTSVEGPHYPKPHSWYARVRVEDGVIVKVIS